MLIVTTFLAALMAGLFFAYSCSVSPGLASLSDKEFVSAMQYINRAIQNPVFFTVFFGILIALPICAYLHYHQPVSLRFWLILFAALIYGVGVFGITAMCNVPLNEALDKFDALSATAEEISRQRAKFEMPWNNWNLIRTLASAIAAILLIGACATDSAKGG